MDKSYPLGKLLLWTIAIYHAVLGILLFVSGELSIQAAKALMGWTIVGSPTLGIVGEILGCYFIAFGLMMAIAAMNPVSYRAFITAGIVLIVLRLFQRLVFSGKVMEVFEVSTGRYWGAFVFVLLIGAALTLLRVQIQRDLGAAKPAGQTG
jgi:hypothetical protein